MPHVVVCRISSQVLFGIADRSAYIVPPMSPCPSDDELGALAQRALADHDAKRVRSHIDECQACAHAVVAVMRGPTAPLRPRRDREEQQPRLAPDEMIAIGTVIGPPVSLGSPA